MATHRISKVDLWVMITLSVILDVLSIILVLTGVGAVIDLFLTIIAYALLIVLFRLKNVKIFSVSTVKRIAESKSSKSGRGRLAKKIWAMIGEFIPFIDLFIPGYTLFTYYTYKDAKDEDEAKTKSGEQIKSSSYLQRIKRRGSVEGSIGNRMESRRSVRSVRGGKEEDQENNVLQFRQKRSSVKYGYGESKDRGADPGLKKAANQ